MYHRILVPLDDSAPAERGLREAIRLAADQKAKLFLLHVIDDYPILTEGTPRRSFAARLERARRPGAELLAKANDATAEHGVPAETKLRGVTQASVADAIVDEAEKLGCDLIVMGTHGRRGISRLTLGSEAELVVRNSAVPVLLVRKETLHAGCAVA
jgi:nucleotide-binding universal stress UspA family protein